MAFRHDINGLRAIAVIAVVLFYYMPAWLPGGFSGIDIFFVISGYLMTGVIFRDLSSGCFSLSAFYKSRALRVLPALLAMCVVLLGLGWFYLPSLEFSDLGRQTAISLGFFSNFITLIEAGDLAHATQQKWLLHTWSLSVQLQFYLLYPIVLILLSRALGLRALRWIVLSSCLGGCAFSVFASFKWPDPAFYSLPARAWELLIGGVAWLFPISLGPWHRRALEAVGLALMLAGFVLLSEQDVWPGYLALLPVLGALAVIVAGRQDSIITGNAFCRWTGKASYSLYLWNWPVVVFMGYAGLVGSTLNALLAVGVTFALAWASYLIFEKQDRKLVGEPAPIP